MWSYTVKLSAHVHTNGHAYIYVRAYSQTTAHMHAQHRLARHTATAAISGFLAQTERYR